MLRALCELESVTPLTFNKKLRSEKKEANESWDEFEARTWHERCDVNSNGNLYISGQRIKKAIVTAAGWLNMKIEGEGMAKYQKHFRGGILVMGSIDLKIKPIEVECLSIYTSPRPKDGKRWINFPIINSWSGDLMISILDEKVTEDIFRKVLDYAGMIIGIGSWRPENGGENGRFECLKIEFERS